MTDNPFHQNPRSGLCLWLAWHYIARIQAHTSHLATSAYERV
ncbi:MAG: hypothetical protein ACRDHW_16560 [Ktedonobacteraceae bacterium]